MDRATTQRVGVPDFLICYAGRFISLEVKRPGKKPTNEQRNELAWIRSAGGLDAVVTSLDEVKAILEMVGYAQLTTPPNPIS